MIHKNSYEFINKWIEFIRFLRFIACLATWLASEPGTWQGSEPRQQARESSLPRGHWLAGVVTVAGIVTPQTKQLLILRQHQGLALFCAVILVKCAWIFKFTAASSTRTHEDNFQDWTIRSTTVEIYMLNLNFKFASKLEVLLVY